MGLPLATHLLLGFAGPRAEAEEIKRRLAEFLRDELKLELSPEKTLITHGRTQAARFLGYEMVVFHDDAKRKHAMRSINGCIGLPRLKWVMERSLTTTLAGKHRTRVSKIYKRYAANLQRPEGSYKGLRVVVDRGEGRRPLVAEWGGIPLRRRKDAILDNQPMRVWNVGTELLQRLTADECELCGSHEQVEVHHVRALKTLQPMRSGPKPEWAKVMIARKRKTLVVCHDCHLDIQHGRPRRQARI